MGYWSVGTAPALVWWMVLHVLSAMAAEQFVHQSLRVNALCVRVRGAIQMVNTPAVLVLERGGRLGGLGMFDLLWGVVD